MSIREALTFDDVLLVPGASDVGLGVSMFSYAGGVRVGILADATLIPDPDRLCTHLQESLVDLAASVAR